MRETSGLLQGDQFMSLHGIGLEAVAEIVFPAVRARGVARHAEIRREVADSEHINPSPQCILVVLWRHSNTLPLLVCAIRRDQTVNLAWAL